MRLKVEILTVIFLAFEVIILTFHLIIMAKNVIILSFYAIIIIYKSIFSYVAEMGFARLFVNLFIYRVL